MAHMATQGRPMCPHPHRVTPCRRATPSPGNTPHCPPTPVTSSTCADTPCCPCGPSDTPCHTPALVTSLVPGNTLGTAPLSQPGTINKMCELCFVSPACAWGGDGTQQGQTPGSLGGAVGVCRDEGGSPRCLGPLATCVPMGQWGGGQTRSLA